MLDQALRTQLRELFAELPRRITLALRPSSHSAQAELVELAEDLASTSAHIDVAIQGAPADTVQLALQLDGVDTGVSFRGVPGGHEFTSLVLAILHANDKGKLPDAMLRNRIAALGSPATVRTYVSLSCTNCPEVVQALNTVALLHGNLKHEMVDGALHPEEVERLGIQGVPAVFVGDELVQSGKASLVELLAKLEQKLGTRAKETGVLATPEAFDMVVVGGGPAGVSAAIYSARKGLKTALIAERVGGQVLETVGIENLIGQKYTEGKRLSAELDAHVRAYSIALLEHRKVVSLRQGDGYELALDSGETVRATQVVVATGAKWRELGVPGEREYLGRGVAFCPHCDGPFYANKRVAVVGGGNSGVEAALDLSAIAAHVTVLEYGGSLRADAVLQQKMRETPNITVVTHAATRAVLGDGTKVHALQYLDRSSDTEIQLELDGVFVQIGLVPNSGFLSDVVERNANGEIIVDARGRTSAPGLYAAGDVTTVPFKQIVIALGEGAKVALTAFEDRMLRQAA